MDRITNRAFWLIVLVAIAAYVVMVATIPSTAFLAILNATFVGLAGGCLFAFRGLIARMAWSRDDLEDWRLFFMSIMTGGLALLLMTLVSIASLSTGRNPWDAAIHVIAFAKYAAILSAVGIILSPGFHHGYFRGEDKQVVWASVIFGLAIAAIIIFLQLSTATEIK